MIHIQGNDGTTINGETSAVEVSRASRLSDHLFAQLGAGDDVLLLSGVSIGKTATILGQSGNDQVGFDTVTVGRSLHVLTAGGNDTVNLKETRVNRVTTVHTGSGDDLVNTVDSTFRNMVVQTGVGDDDVVMTSSSARRGAVITTGANADTVVLSDAHFSRSVVVNTGRGSDFVDIQAGRVSRTAILHTGAGTDNVRIHGATTLRRVRTVAGTGIDAVQVDTDTVISKRSVVRQEELSVVDETVANERLNDTETGALARSSRTQAFFDDLQSASTSNSAPVASEISDISVSQNADSSVVDLRSSFEDQQDTDAELRFSIQQNTNADLFRSVAIDQDSGQLTLDFSAFATGTAVITVLATDTGGLTGSTSFQVTVSPITNALFVSSAASAGAAIGNVQSSSVTGDVIFELERPSQEALLQLNADDHLSGASASKVVLIEYFDLQCPACATYHPIVKQIKQDFEDDLVVVSRHLPITTVHPNAERAAVASEAAAEQGMFDEMVDLLFTNQSEWSGATDPTSFFEGYASSLGLNEDQFSSDLGRSDLLARVTRDSADAASLELTSVPTFFFNGSNTLPDSSIAAFTAQVNSSITAFDNGSAPFLIAHSTGHVVVAPGSTLANLAGTVEDFTVRVTNTDSQTELISVSVSIISES